MSMWKRVFSSVGVAVSVTSCTILLIGSLVYVLAPPVKLAGEWVNNTFAHVPPDQGVPIVAALVVGVVAIALGTFLISFIGLGE